MSKYFKLLFMVFVLICLTGCEKDPVDALFVVTFQKGDTVLSTQDVNQDDNQLSLDLLEEEEEGKLFVGWSDGQEIYYDHYIVTSDVTLTAIFENVSDVFELNVFEESNQDTAGITSYTGQSQYLKIPQIIDGHIITFIAPYAFENSQLIEVRIPMDARVGIYAFKDNLLLKRVRLYGNYLEYKESIISNQEYDNFIDENSEICSIETITENGWIFTQGCPIVEVIGRTNSVFIGGVEYFTYQVLQDKNLLESLFEVQYDLRTFIGDVSLESVDISAKRTVFLQDAFKECINLKELILVGESEKFVVIDHILYSKDMKELVFYPAGKEETSYVIPDSVNSIAPQAFLDNHYIEQLSLHENFTRPIYLHGLGGLAEFIVDLDNPVYQSIDGVLYASDTLVKYPAAKAGTSYTLVEGTTEIVDLAFAENKYLESIDFKNQLTRINSSVFMGTQALEVIELPNSVNFIGLNILMDSSVETIVIHAASADNVIMLLGGFQQQQQQIQSIDIYITDIAVDAYKGASKWRTYEAYIFPLSTYTEK